MTVIPHVVMIDRDGFMPPAQVDIAGVVVAGREYAAGWAKPENEDAFGVVLRMRTRRKWRVKAGEREALMWQVEDPETVVSSGQFDEPAHDAKVVWVRLDRTPGDTRRGR